MPTRRQLALIHVAKAKVGLTEDEWRAALVQVAGVESARELDREGFDAMMGLMEHLGFRPLTVRGPTYGSRPGFASPAQVQLVRALWDEYTEGPRRRAQPGLVARPQLRRDEPALPDGREGEGRHHGAQDDEGEGQARRLIVAQGGRRGGVRERAAPADSRPLAKRPVERR